MIVFYAFCRRMDDLADDEGMPVDQRAAQLEAWKIGLEDGFSAPDEFQREVVSLRDRRNLPTELLLEIIDGCRMDLSPIRFETWEQLSHYTWKVACAVGLVSVRLFGCSDPRSETYAVSLGHALQLTNILRDVGEDFANGGRVYLPLEDLARFGYSEADISGHVHDQRFLSLMNFQADRAIRYFVEAEAAISRPDRMALLPARIMAEIYRRLLTKMRSDGFRVFEKRYQVSKARKLAILSKHLIARPCRVG